MFFYTCDILLPNNETSSVDAASVDLVWRVCGSLAVQDQVVGGHGGGGGGGGGWRVSRPLCAAVS